MLKYKKVPSLFFDGQYGLKCNIWNDPNFLSEYPDATPEEVRAYFGYEPEESESESPTQPQPPTTPQPVADPFAWMEEQKKKKEKKWREWNPVPINRTDSIADNNFLRVDSIMQNTPAIAMRDDSIRQYLPNKALGDSVERVYEIVNASSWNEPYNPNAYGARNIVVGAPPKVDENGVKSTSVSITSRDVPEGERYIGFTHVHNTKGTVFSPEDVNKFAEIRWASQYEQDKRWADASATTIAPTYVYRLMPNNTAQFAVIKDEMLAQLETDFMRRINAAGVGANQESAFVATYMLDPQIKETFNLYRSERKNDGTGEQFYKLDISSGNPVWRPVKKE